MLAVYGAFATVLAIMAFAFLLYERRELAAAHAELDRAVAALAAARPAAVKTKAAASEESFTACLSGIDDLRDRWTGDSGRAELAEFQDFVEDAYENGVSDKTFANWGEASPLNEKAFNYVKSCAPFFIEMEHGSPRHCAAWLEFEWHRSDLAKEFGPFWIFRFNRTLAAVVSSVDPEAMTDEDRIEWLLALSSDLPDSGLFVSQAGRQPCRDLFAEPASAANARLRNEWAFKGCSNSWNDSADADEMTRLYQTPLYKLTERQKDAMRRALEVKGIITLDWSLESCAYYFPQMFLGLWIPMPDGYPYPSGRMNLDALPPASNEAAQACAAEMRRHESKNRAAASAASWTEMKLFLSKPRNWKNGVSDETLLLLADDIPQGEGFSACGEFLDHVGRGSPRHCAAYIAQSGSVVYGNVIADAVRKIDTSRMTDEERGNWYRARFGYNDMRPDLVVSDPCRDMFAKPASYANGERRNEWARHRDTPNRCGKSLRGFRLEASNEIAQLWKSHFYNLTESQKILLRGLVDDGLCAEYFP